jgi:DNA-binding transcriptional regulator PaaX
MFKTNWGEDQDLIIKKIKSKGGIIKHSDLIRLMQYKMSAQNVRTLVGSLKEAGVVTEQRSAVDHVYVLTELANAI